MTEQTGIPRAPYGFDAGGYYLECPACPEKLRDVAGMDAVTGYTMHYAAQHGPVKWVSDAVRALAAPDEYGRTMPFAVYARLPRGEYAYRNLSLEGAEELAGKLAAKGTVLHVSLDTCG